MANLHHGDQGGHRRGAAAVLQGDRARSGVRVGLRDGGVVPFLAQGQRLDDRSARGRSPRARDWPGAPSNWARTMRSRSRAAAMRSRHLAGDLDGGIALLDRALVLNPNLAAAWFLGGFLRIWRGEPDDAIEHFARAMRLSPLDPEMYRMQAGMAMAHLLAGRFDAASSWAEKAFRELPSFLMVVGIIAASHALAGRIGGSATSDAAVARSSIPRCASPISRIGSRSAGRKISPCSRTACEEQGCRNDGPMSIEGSVLGRLAGHGRQAIVAAEERDKQEASPLLNPAPEAMLQNKPVGHGLRLDPRRSRRERRHRAQSGRSRAPRASAGRPGIAR